MSPKNFLAGVLALVATSTAPAAPVTPGVDPAANGRAFEAVRDRVAKGERVTLYVGFAPGKPEPGTALATLPSWAGVETTDPVGVYRCYKDPETGRPVFSLLLTAYIPPPPVQAPCRT